MKAKCVFLASFIFKLLIFLQFSKIVLSPERLSKKKIGSRKLGFFPDNFGISYNKFFTLIDFDLNWSNRSGDIFIYVKN